ncbi:MAG: hypothetical protein ACE5MM_03905 [Nitrospiraceae bacterium]
MSKRISDINFVSYVVERDIDLLFLEELRVAPDFRDWLTRQLLDDEPQIDEFVGVWHSVSDTSYGESDLIYVVTLVGSDGTVGILIENKIGAVFQPDQAHRYRKRGEKGKKDGWWDRFVTCLVAPSRYLHGKHTEIFDREFPYEPIADWFACRSDDRAKHKEDLLRCAIEQSRTGWQMIPDATVTGFFKSYWKIASAEFPELRMQTPGDLPAKSTWACFNRTGLPKGIVIFHKLEKGFVDLSFSATLSSDLAAAYSEVLEGDMEIHQTNKSSVVRMEVPIVDAYEAFDGQTGNVRTCLEAAKRLLNFYRENESRVVGIGS